MSWISVPVGDGAIRAATGNGGGDSTDWLLLVIPIVTAVLAGVLAAAIQRWRSKREQRVAIGNAFRAIVEGLAGSDPVERLPNAILLRRFFSLRSEWSLRNELPYADDAIDVIAAALRAEPTGDVQKTLADGLAFAPRQDLRLRDFQETNLRRAYLSLSGAAARTLTQHGGRWWQRWSSPPSAKRRLDVSGADFYRANLTEASFRESQCRETTFYNAVCVRTVYRDAILVRANFSGADLRNADLRTVDAREADFSGADLKGARFDGALLLNARFDQTENTPRQVEEHLTDGVFASADPVEPGKVDPEPTQETPRIFLSVPNGGSSTLPDLIADAVREEGCDVRRIRRDAYHEDRHLAEIRQEITSCVGVIVVGLPQLWVERGVWRRHTEEETPVTNEGLATPWNDIEAGVAVGADLPILALRAGSRAQGIFGLVGESGRYKLMEIGDDWTRAEVRTVVREWVAPLS